jgi:hypothetical protein
MCVHGVVVVGPGTLFALCVMQRQTAQTEKACPAVNAPLTRRWLLCSETLVVVSEEAVPTQRRLMRRL